MSERDGFDTIIRGGLLVSPEGSHVSDIGVRGEKIAAIGPAGTLTGGASVIEADGCHVLPGLVDPHTHPGNYRPLEMDVRSETVSAAVGGVTTMIGTVKSTRMGPQSPTADSYLEVFDSVRQTCDELAHVDTAFSFVVMNGLQAREIGAAGDECGVRSFKFFVTFPPETPWGAHVGMPVFPDDAALFEGLRQCAATGSLAMLHAENAQIVRAPAVDARGQATDLTEWEARFPGFLEASEIRKVSFLAGQLGTKIYIVHVSSMEGLEAVEKARAEGVPVVAETCPQYLILNADEHAARGPLAKFNPPVRGRQHGQSLWEAVADGRIDCLGSDHIPSMRQNKMPDSTFDSAHPGSPGVATLLPLLWTFGVAAGRLTPERLVEVCCAGPARAFELHPRKGTLAPGADADLVIVDGTTRKAVDPGVLFSSSDWSAYEGMELTGWPRLTMLRGAVVARDGEPIGRPRGRYLSRPYGSAALGDESGGDAL
jgi:dihydropyrimidinase